MKFEIVTPMHSKKIRNDLDVLAGKIHSSFTKKQSVKVITPINQRKYKTLPYNWFILTEYQPANS